MNKIRNILIVGLLSIILLVGTSCTKTRKIVFSDYEWEIKSSKKQVGPGNNYFSDSEKNIWVDERGLHLRLRYEDGKWYCSEVINKKTLGYGKYIFYIISEDNNSMDKLDKNVVFGMFTYDNTDKDNTREIDIEFSQFGDDKNSRGHYVIYGPGNEIVSNDKKFNEIDNQPFELEGSYTTHIIDWQKESIKYESIHGHLTDPNKVRIKSYIYPEIDNEQTIPIPDEGNARVRINLWLFKSKPPTDNEEVEIIINKFEFIPYKNK